MLEFYLKKKILTLGPKYLYEYRDNIYSSLENASLIDLSGHSNKKGLKYERKWTWLLL